MKHTILVTACAVCCSLSTVHAQAPAPKAPAEKTAPEKTTSGKAAATAEKALAPVKPPAGVNPRLTSDDADYGHSKQKPIKVGSKDFAGGPAAERAYLDTLRDEAGKPVTYQRQGSVGAGPDGNVLDAYEVTTSTGRALTLYIDMYHPKSDPKKQPAP